MTKKQLFSIIIPTYNEEKDIRETLLRLIGMSYENKEILVVDDSKDKTPEIVKEYASRGVRLIDGPRKGCCEAVNLGIQEAKGDIIVNVDADVRPPVDFLDKLAEKYEAGADWVLVDSKVPNTKSVYSRFVGALHVKEHVGRSDMYYSEAFSCRRDLALKLGSFGASYPLRFCRDWLLGKKLTDAGCKKVYDPTLAVMHPQPDTCKDYWATRRARGTFGPLRNYFMDNFSLPRIALKLMIKDALCFIRFFLVVPVALRVWQIARHSERGRRDFIPFLYAYTLQEAARVVGEWEAWERIKKLPRELRKSHVPA